MNAARDRRIKTDMRDARAQAAQAAL